MLTVEADPALVEARLLGGRVDCPVCSGVLAPWGWARARRVHGLGSVARPRRGRCRGCGLTHVLLPVTLLARRGYAAVMVVTALLARAEGCGYRRAAVRVGAPADTVRGWLRCMSGRLDAVREVFVAVAVRAGVDQPAPLGAGGRWADMLAGLGAATAALRARFGTGGLFGQVTADRVAVACSNGRLLSPGWPGQGQGRWPTPVASAGLR